MDDSWIHEIVMRGEMAEARQRAAQERSIQLAQPQRRRRSAGAVLRQLTHGIRRHELRRLIERMVQS